MTWIIQLLTQRIVLKNKSMKKYSTQNYCYIFNVKKLDFWKMKMWEKNQLTSKGSWRFVGLSSMNIKLFYYLNC